MVLEVWLQESFGLIPRFVVVPAVTKIDPIPPVTLASKSLHKVRWHGLDLGLLVIGDFFGQSIDI
jgi:hypothetical protein